MSACIPLLFWHFTACEQCSVVLDAYKLMYHSLIRPLSQQWGHRIISSVQQQHYGTAATAKVKYTRLQDKKDSSKPTVSTHGCMLTTRFRALALYSVLQSHSCLGGTSVAITSDCGPRGHPPAACRSTCTTLQLTASLHHWFADSVSLVDAAMPETMLTGPAPTGLLLHTYIM